VVTGQLDNVEKGCILVGRTQQGVRATYGLDGRWREAHPTLAASTEQPLMQTTRVEGHRRSLAVRPWLYRYHYVNYYERNIIQLYYSFKDIIYSYFSNKCPIGKFQDSERLYGEGNGRYEGLSFVAG